MNRPILAVALLSLSVVSARQTQAATLEESCVKSIEAVASAYENWTEVVCPIYVDVVQFYVDIGLPSVAATLADVFEGVVCAVADGHLAAINAIANGCAIAGVDVESAAAEASEAVESAKLQCTNAIVGPVE